MDLETSVQTVSTAPSEVLLQILSYLDVRSVCACMKVSKSFFQIVEEKLWKIIFFRDFPHYLYQMPLGEEELESPQKDSDIQLVRKFPISPACAINESFQDTRSEIQEQILMEASVQLQNWKGLYILCYMKIDLNGYWIGDYGRHGNELIRIYQKGYEVIAKKVTGDENVPAGQTAWKMTLDKTMAKGKGFMQVAEIGYKNAAWVTSYINVVDNNTIQITWFVYDLLGNWYSVTFGTVRAGAANYNNEALERKVSMMTFSEV